MLDLSNVNHSLNISQNSKLATDLEGGIILKWCWDTMTAALWKFSYCRTLSHSVLCMSNLITSFEIKNSASILKDLKQGVLSSVFLHVSGRWTEGEHSLQVCHQSLCNSNHLYCQTSETIITQRTAPTQTARGKSTNL